MVDRRSSAVARLLGCGVLAGIGWVFGGPVGLAAIAVTVPLAVFVGPRWVAVLALGSLAVAASTTVVEVWPIDLLYDDFARRRPVASEAGRVAGILLFVSLIISAYRERSEDRRPIG